MNTGSVLIATTAWWPAPARLAMAFSGLGVRVDALCPYGHPLRRTRSVASCRTYPFVRPLAALCEAITALRPDFVVACDDRAVHHLHTLHDLDRGGPVAELIAGSMGAGSSFPIVASRHGLLRLAMSEGVRVPPTALLRSEADLDQWQQPLPWVLKCGMSWGGAGVRIVHNRAEAVRVFRAMARPVGVGRAIKRLAINGDGFSLGPAFARTVPEVIVQRFIPGTPASTTIACWRGSMLAQLSVRALGTQGPTGASTVIEVIDHDEMSVAASRLAARLELSGFHGLDFMLDADGAPWLIEFNPRSTQVCHLAIEDGVSLAEVFLAARSGRPVCLGSVAPVGSTIALFPQAWRSDPTRPLLRSASHDVPWEEPELVLDLMRPPWPNRGLLARLWQDMFDPKAGKDYWAGAAPVAAEDTPATGGVTMLASGDTAPDRTKLPA